jgi:hypothetical protein
MWREVFRDSECRGDFMLMTVLCLGLKSRRSLDVFWHVDCAAQTNDNTTAYI